MSDKEKARALMKELLELRADINDSEKTLSRIRTETLEIYGKLDEVLNGEEVQR